MAPLHVDCALQYVSEIQLKS